MEKKQPEVSVVIITYNHEQYIRQTIESILLQKVDFQYELIISDDNSTDDTSQIVQQIIKSHPLSEKISYFRHQANIGMSANLHFALGKANSEYVAFCEGDDYWTDINKLQKQYQFLCRKPDYSLVCTRYKIFNQVTNEYQAFNIGLKFNADNSGITFTETDSVWVQLLTIMFRKSAYEKSLSFNYKYFRDLHLIHHLLLTGKGYYLPDVTGVYRIHNGGISSNVNPVSNNFILYKIMLEILENAPTFRARRQFSVLAAHLFYARYKHKDLKDNPFSYSDVRKSSILLFLFYLIRIKIR